MFYDLLFHNDDMYYDLYEDFDIESGQINTDSFFKREKYKAPKGYFFYAGHFKRGEQVSALLVPLEIEDCFSFEMYVAKSHRERGLEADLVGAARAYYNDIQNDHPSEFRNMKICTHAVSKDQVTLLKELGFKSSNRSDKTPVLMKASLA